MVKQTREKIEERRLAVKIPEALQQTVLQKLGVDELIVIARRGVIKLQTCTKIQPA